MNLFGKKLKLITHDGSFHADDVFACASLSILLEKRGERFELIRTRDAGVVVTGDFVFDVGGIYDANANRFDHHQQGFDEKRENGIVYSSFGLIWKKYGEEICGSDKTSKFIDQMLVEQVDATDNGITLFSPLTTHTTSYDISAVVASFLPKFDEKNEDECFLRAVAFTKSLLQKEIERYNRILKEKTEFDKVYQVAEDKRLVILSKEVPRYLMHYVAEDYPEILFAVFPNENKWKIFAFRKRAGSFELRKSLPSAWAGLYGEELQKVSGIPDAEFCHRNLFLGVASSREGAVKMAQIALES